jgi:hypothetical protein
MRRCAKLPIVQRWRLLASPWFTGMVFLLALNDQILKARYPGFVTGKLSDFAGVVVIAMLLGTVLSARSACVATAVVFTALKSSHSVALLVAPFLGGITLADRTDLIALSALVPVCRWLVRHGPTSPTTMKLNRMVLLPLVLIATTGTITADSCDRDTGIIGFQVGDNSTIEAQRLVTDYLPVERTVAVGAATSRDGAVWAPLERDREAPPSATLAEQCDPEGTCYRVVKNERVEQRTLDSQWSTSFAFSREQRHRMERRRPGACSYVDSDLFQSVAVGRTSTGSSVVLVAMGTQGALVRIDGGEWRRVSVPTSYDTYKPLTVIWPRWLERLYLSPLLLVVVWPVLRRRRRWKGRPRRTSDGYATAWVLAVCLAVFFGLLQASLVGYEIGGPLLLVLSGAAFAASVIIGLTPSGARLFRRRRRPPWPAPDSRAWVPPSPRR